MPRMLSGTKALKFTPRAPPAGCLWLRFFLFGEGRRRLFPLELKAMEPSVQAIPPPRNAEFALRKQSLTTGDEVLQSSPPPYTSAWFCVMSHETMTNGEWSA